MVEGPEAARRFAALAARNPISAVLVHVAGFAAVEGFARFDFAAEFSAVASSCIARRIRGFSSAASPPLLFDTARAGKIA